MTNANLLGSYEMYVCPACRNGLHSGDGVLHCRVCDSLYPIVDGAPDFILEDLSECTNPLLRWASRNYDRQAPIYEISRYPWRLFLYGEMSAPSFDELIRTVSRIAGTETGLVLDVACGPGTLARRMTTQATGIFGVDISSGMLHQGITLARRSHIDNIYFARGQAEQLPFRDSQFDAAVCGSALHFFADPLIALREISRTMKQGAPLVVITLVDENPKKTVFRRLRDRLLLPPGTHLFRRAELERIVAEAGFVAFHPRNYGSMVLFSARKNGGYR